MSFVFVVVVAAGVFAQEGEVRGIQMFSIELTLHSWMPAKYLLCRFSMWTL